MDQGANPNLQMIVGKIEVQDATANGTIINGVSARHEDVWSTPLDMSIDLVLPDVLAKLLEKGGNALNVQAKENQTYATGFGFVQSPDAFNHWGRLALAMSRKLSEDHETNPAIWVDVMRMGQMITEHSSFAKLKANPMWTDLLMVGMGHGAGHWALDVAEFLYEHNAQPERVAEMVGDVCASLAPFNHLVSLGQSRQVKHVLTEAVGVVEEEIDQPRLNMGRKM